MKFLLSLSVIFYAFTISANASINHPQNVHQSDTLKKGKNYILYSKTAEVERVAFSKSRKSKDNIVYIRFGFPAPAPSSNSNNTAVLQSNRKYKEDDALPNFEKIDILKGKYEDIKVSKETKYKNLFTFTGIEFPLRLKLNSGKETIDLEVTEAGEWNLDIELKNN